MQQSETIMEGKIRFGTAIKKIKYLYVENFKNSNDRHKTICT